MAEELLTTKELARRLRLTTVTVRKMVAQGKIPEIAVSWITRRFDWKAVLKALKKRESARKKMRKRTRSTATCKRGLRHKEYSSTPQTERQDS